MDNIKQELNISKEDKMALLVKYCLSPICSYCKNPIIKTLIDMNGTNVTVNVYSDMVISFCSENCFKLANGENIIIPSICSECRTDFVKSNSFKDKDITRCPECLIKNLQTRKES